MSKPKISGYVVCAHTCVLGGCWNRTTNSILWNRNVAAYRHACALKPHSNCTEDCPAHDFLEVASHSDATRVPTEAEFQEFLRTQEEDAHMDVDEELPRSESPMSTTTQNAEITYLFNAARSVLPVTQLLQPLKIIFIPDATLAIKQKSAALNDLAFFRTYISEDEYNAIAHLNGSIHSISKTKDRHYVVMQEWVRMTLRRNSAKILTMRQLYITILMQRWNRQGSRVDPNRRFNISYMQWDVFIEFLKNPHEHAETGALLAAADCVMGGFDLDSPYL